MRRHAGFVGWLVVLFAWFVPALALADVLTIHDVDLPREGDPAAQAKVGVYFELRHGGEAVTGVKAEDCTITIDDRMPEVISAEIKDFVQGNRGVGILFVFPVAKNYSEDSFGIRRHLSTLVQRIDRPIDMLNAVPYDMGAKSMGWSRASERTLLRALEEIRTTDAIEPNLFSAFGPTIAVMEGLQNVSQKYIVLISDAEGAIMGDLERAQQLISQFVEQLKKHNIRPIVVAYSPDGRDGLPNAGLIKRIATLMGAPYFEATDESKFQQIIQQDVFNYIFKQSIYEATLNMDGSNFLEAGKYPLQLTVKLANSEEKAATKISWPSLKKGCPKFCVILLVLGVLVIGAAAFIIIRRCGRGNACAGSKRMRGKKEGERVHVEGMLAIRGAGKEDERVHVEGTLTVRRRDEESESGPGKEDKSELGKADTSEDSKGDEQDKKADLESDKSDECVKKDEPESSKVDEPVEKGNLESGESDECVKKDESEAGKAETFEDSKEDERGKEGESESGKEGESDEEEKVVDEDLLEVCCAACGQSIPKEP